jgi:hypothetical protein
MAPLGLLEGLKDLQDAAKSVPWYEFFTVESIVKRHVAEHVGYVSAMQPDLREDV